jgi:hypothetical protein
LKRTFQEAAKQTEWDVRAAHRILNQQLVLRATSRLVIHKQRYYLKARRFTAREPEGVVKLNDGLAATEHGAEVLGDGDSI